MCAEVPGLKPGSSLGPQFRLPCSWVLLGLMVEAAEMLHGRGERNQAGKCVGGGVSVKDFRRLEHLFWGFSLLVLTGPLVQSQTYPLRRRVWAAKQT